MDEPPLKIDPIHEKLLKRGLDGRWIWLDDDMMFRVGQICAPGELERTGLVEQAKGPFPPGPPSLKPRILTEAGRAALAKINR
jgi:hypothetical protein